MIDSDENLESQDEDELDEPRDETSHSDDAFDDEREKLLREWVDRFAAITQFDTWATGGDGLDDNDPAVRAFRQWIATHARDEVALPTPGGGTEICEIYLTLKAGCEFSTTDKAFARFARYSETVRLRIKQFDEQFRGWTLDEIEDDDGPEYLLANTIPTGQITCFYGKAKHRKSAMLHKLACCVGTPGMDFDGEPVPHGRILYVSVDPGANRKKVKLRIKEICERMGANPYSNFILVDTQLCLDKPESVAGLLTRNPGRFELVVIDSLYMSVTPGSSLAQDSVMIPATRGLREIADATGAAVVVLHHEGRGGLGHPFGSGFLETAVSSLVHVVLNEKTDKMTATVEFMKNGDKRETPFMYQGQGAYVESLAPKRIGPTRSDATAAPSIVPDVPHADMLALIPTTPTPVREARRLIEHMLTGSPDAKRKQWERARADWAAAGWIVQRDGTIRRVAP
jgi:hypothetical protein